MPHYNYKTKPCYSFEKSGHCQKGQQCQYAHGLQELRQNQHQHHQQELEKHGGDWNKGAWLPPGADRGNQVLFGASFDPSFYIPPRLADKSADLVNAVNDFHFAMVNDFERNEFYRKCLEKVITPNSRVLEIGTGSGLLAMIAARLGAEWVLAVEANKDMAELARQNIAKNNLSERIRVLNMLSTELELKDMPSKANVLVSELFGTLLLGESALNYLYDARQRLLEPNSHIVPPKGIQYVTPIECKDLESITSVSSWGGLDLRHLNTLQDTVSVVFTKQYGFRFSTVPMTIMADKIPILEVDFSKNGPDDMPKQRTFPIRCKSAGTIHCLMLTWEVYDNEGTEVMSTDPSRTTFARDMQWGQALQLLEDGERGDGTYPVPFRVEEGELLTLGVKYSCDGVVVQFDVRRNR